MSPPDRPQSGRPQELTPSERIALGWLLQRTRSVSNRHIGAGDKGLGIALAPDPALILMAPTDRDGAELSAPELLDALRRLVTGLAALHHSGVCLAMGLQRSAIALTATGLVFRRLGDLCPYTAEAAMNDYVTATAVVAGLFGIRGPHDQPWEFPEAGAPEPIGPAREPAPPAEFERAVVLGAFDVFVAEVFKAPVPGRIASVTAEFAAVGLERVLARRRASEPVSQAAADAGSRPALARAQFATAGLTNDAVWKTAALAWELPRRRAHG